MRTISGISAAAIFVSFFATACGDGGGGSTTSSTTGGGSTSSTTGGTGGQGGGGAASVAISVSPATATVLTCTKATFGATVTGSSDTGVTWSASPGTIDAAGVYSAPIQVPDPATVTVTAASHADPAVKKDASVTLATAVPGAEVVVNVTKTTDVSVYQHQLAARGDRVYAAYAAGDHDVLVRRSDDGGKTWGAEVNAAPDADVAASCVVVAVDAVDPEVVYVVYRLAATTIYQSFVPKSDNNDAIVFAASADGGKTWTRRPLMLGGVAGGPYGGHNTAGYCPDVISPAKDAVIVEWPGGYSGDGNPDMYVFADPSRGAGFAKGQGDGWDYQADGETGALATVGRAIGLDVGQGGGSGDVTESPRLFTDGKGKVCLTWMGSGWTESKDGVYVQCSTDLAKTFGAPAALTPTVLSGPHVPAGAIGPSGELAVIWHADQEPAGTLLLSTSADGETWSGPASIPMLPSPASDVSFAGGDADLGYDADGVLWIAYHIHDGGLSDRIAVDKSCDGGKTWSGAVLVNGPEGSITDARLPALLLGGSAPRVGSYTGVGSVEGALAQIAPLVP